MSGRRQRVAGASWELLSRKRQVTGSSSLFRRVVGPDRILDVLSFQDLLNLRNDLRMTRGDIGRFSLILREIV